MSLLQSIFKEEKTHKLGVCIPEHAKERQDAINKKILEAIDKDAALQEEIIRQVTAKPKAKTGAIKGSFRVEGIYRVGDTIMLKGKVVSGRIRKGMKSEFMMKKTKVCEAQLKGNQVKSLNEGEEGAIYVEKGLIHLKMGDLIEFF